jgi:hypothetical protein
VVGHTGSARPWPVVFAVLVVGVLVLAVPALAQASDEHGNDDMAMAEGLLPPGHWTPEQIEKAADLVARTEAELPAYADVTKLPEMGFHNFGVTAPGGYDHWINNSRMDDGHVLDPKYPESLVFQAVDGAWKLQAAMFYLPSGYDLTNVPEDIAWYPGWHVHSELCSTPDWKFTGLSGGECPPGSAPGTRPMMHVWIVDNPCGNRFAGVGVGGIECGEHHMPGPPGTVFDPGTRPGTVPRPMPPGSTMPGRVQKPDKIPLPAPPATPVPATPHYTG